MPSLFEPLQLRSISLRNRIGFSPTCQYSAADGKATSWHLAHIGPRAVGGIGIIIVEAAGVSPEARITHGCLGMWNDAQVEAIAPIVSFIRAQGAVAGIQLSHSGRKGSTNIPWIGGAAPLNAGEGVWETYAPSPIPYNDEFPVPTVLKHDDLQKIIMDFEQAAVRCHRAGFQVIELHMAHGYLLHQFLSPISNRRSDAFGGSFSNRIAFPLAVAKAVRRAWPDELPLFVRLSVEDWVEDGWNLEQSIRFAVELKAAGIDLIDSSSGAIVPTARGAPEKGWQVPFADAIRKNAKLATAAVGMITEPAHADQIVRDERADLVLLSRAMLRDPYWPMTAAEVLGMAMPWVPQYARGILSLATNVRA